MPIRRTTSPKNIDKYIKQEIKRREKVIINIFRYVGERCVIEGRTNGNYTDRTGNLRSSIGYVIVKDGRIVHTSSFPQLKDGTDGMVQGEKYAKSLAKQYSKGIVLIVVAGMKYAAFVEALENFNVLSSAELLAKRLLPKMLKELDKIM
ncbi:MAG: hypothetical protein LIP01_05480 [Tannerellaceae bacterium]|nr:hypothetical protein [Tannerellaceae bacterium]